MSKNATIAYTPAQRALPKSWTKAAGLLKHHAAALKRHAKSIRKEWDRDDARY